MSLWHKGGFLQCRERIYDREPSLAISLYQVENSFTVLLEDISRLRSDPDTADFVLRTSKGSRVFPVHKAILEEMEATNPDAIKNQKKTRSASSRGL